MYFFEIKNWRHIINTSSLLRIVSEPAKEAQEAEEEGEGELLRGEGEAAERDAADPDCLQGAAAAAPGAQNAQPRQRDAARRREQVAR